MPKITRATPEITTIQSDITIIKKSVSQLETRFGGLETRFDGLETRFDGLETRFDGLETRVSAVETKLDHVIYEVSDLKEDMTIVKDFLANEAMTKQDKNEILSHIDAFMKKTTKVEDEQVMQTYRLRENTNTLERHDKEIKELQLAVTA